MGFTLVFAIFESSDTDAVVARLVSEREIVRPQVPYLEVAIVGRRDQHVFTLAWVHCESNIVDVFDMGLLELHYWLT